MSGVWGNLYIYPVMNAQFYIKDLMSTLAPLRPFAPRRRP